MDGELVIGFNNLGLTQQEKFVTGTEAKAWLEWVSERTGGEESGKARIDNPFAAKGSRELGRKLAGEVEPKESFVF